MNRRDFIRRSFMAVMGGFVVAHPELAKAINTAASHHGVRQALDASELYKLFRNPDSIYHPFVRWWWNGDKVEPDELKRELRLLKDAGIGGVEINPIEFPSRTDDLKKKSLTWLSDEWIDCVKIACDEAHRLHMTADLLVGSGWPYGAESLKDGERAQIVCVYTQNLQGPIDYEVSDQGICVAANPSISNPFIGKKMDLMALELVPKNFNSIDQAIDLMPKGEGGTYRFKVPEGSWVLYGLVRIDSFLTVINGAPGANGPVLDHMNKNVVSGYLHHMSDTMQQRIGPLKNYIRALFTDSMELEGSNWTPTMRDEFKRRRGYDVMPYLPFLLFKAGSMGNVSDYTPKVNYGKQLGDTIDRVRYDFELTKAELMDENFTKTYVAWCRELGVKSRAQAYGRGLFPLESSMQYDIPEGESWTTNWLRHKIGEEMSETDYRRGRAYTMVDKFVSSAAHLTGKREVSCEEMTNTYLVFAMSLEFLKIGCDQSTISGVTHSVFHGFNYSPNKEAKFPGWIQYGAYYSENNNWWPYFHYVTEYKARLSSVLCNSTMYADIAILNPYTDMWTKMGMQNEPFPIEMYANWTTLVWESIVKTGGGCDYVSESVIRDADIRGGQLCYGDRRYSTLFLLAVERMDERTAVRIYEFVKGGGKVICVDTVPHLSSGLHNHEQRDKMVEGYTNKMRAYKHRFFEVKKPASDYLKWYRELIATCGLPHSVSIEDPNMYLMQNRYVSDDGTDIFFFSYSHLNNPCRTRITFPKHLSRGRQPWVWDLDTGERYRLTLDKNGSREFDFGPCDSLLIVFDKARGGEEWKPLPASGGKTMDITDNWRVEFRYKQENTVRYKHFNRLDDLVNDKDYAGFSGTAIYSRKVKVSEPAGLALNLGKVYGITEVVVNGKSLGVKWYGWRIFVPGDALKAGDNLIEIRLTTTMSNYLARQKDNSIAQRWVRNRADQSIGIVGPVTLYTI